MIRHRNLNGLRMFHHAATLLNFSHAADVLNVTQGAVAQQVRALEADLGVKLFNRRARGLTLTMQGEALAHEIAPALQQIDNALSAVADVSNTVSLSVTPSFAAKWLGPRLPAFMQLHSEIDLQIAADQKVADFQNDKIDMSIRQGTAPKQTNVNWFFLGPHDLVAVASDTLLQGYRDDTPLLSYPLIEDSHRLWAVMMHGQAPASGSRMLRVNQTALALDAAKRGLGVALVPRCYLDPETDQNLRILQTVPEQPDRGFYLLMPKGRTVTPALQTVLDWFINAFS